MWLDFKITDRCNNNCSYCFDKHLSPKSREKFDSEIVINCLNHSISFGFKNIALFGGEPSLRADLRYIIDNINMPVANDITLFFISNGINFNPDVIETLFNSRFKNVVYVQSLDSFKTPNFKNQKVDQILDAIFFTQSLCYKYQNSFQDRKIEIHTVISRENINDIYHFVDFFSSHSIEVGLGLVTPSVFVDKITEDAEYNHFTLDEIRQVIEQLNQLHNESKLNPTNQILKNFLELFPSEKVNISSKCKANEYKTMINSDGSVFRCLYESYLGINSYGNVLTDNLLQIFQKIRKDNNNGECEYKSLCWDYFMQNTRK